jgi:hypothetical protein
MWWTARGRARQRSSEEYRRVLAVPAEDSPTPELYLCADALGREG